MTVIYAKLYAHAEEPVYWMQPTAFATMVIFFGACAVYGIGAAIAKDLKAVSAKMS